MKKTILYLIMLLCTSMAVNAQEAGRMWFGGSLDFQLNKKIGGGRTLSYGFTPEMGYQISDKLAFGDQMIWRSVYARV